MKKKKSKDLKTDQETISESKSESARPSIAVDRALTASCADPQNIILDGRPGGRLPPSGPRCSLLVDRPDGQPTSSSLSSVHFCAWVVDQTVDQASIFSNVLSLSSSCARHCTPISELSSSMPIRFYLLPHTFFTHEEDLLI